MPRVNVTVANKQIVIKKINPQEKFRPISLVLNARNTRLIHNVGLLDIEWVDAAERTGKPMKLAGPKYNPATHTFQDSMDKSATLKIVDKTTKNLFAGKQLGDLLTIQIDGNPLVSAETAEEKDRTLQLGTGKDVSINVNKTSILFNENNVKSGDILDVDNRSGLDQVLGVELPEKGLYYRTIRRKPDQTKVPDGDWKRFTVPANSGILIAMVPDPEPAQLEQLDGKEITIKVYQGNRLRETRRVPIRISPELRLTSGELNPQGEPPEVSDRTGSVSGTNRAGESPESTAPVVQPATSPTQPGRPAKTAASNNLWLWVLVIGNMAVLVSGSGIRGFLRTCPRSRSWKIDLPRMRCLSTGAEKPFERNWSRSKTKFSNSAPGMPDLSEVFAAHPGDLESRCRRRMSVNVQGDALGSVPTQSQRFSTTRRE